MNGLKRSPMNRGTSTLARAPMDRGTTPMVRTQFKRKPCDVTGKPVARMKHGKKAATVAEQRWMDWVAAFGCVVCWLDRGAKTPCAVHHLVAGGRRLGHFHTIGLCDPGHHQHSPTAEKISRHPDKARFEATYGTEVEMLDFLRAEHAKEVTDGR